MNDVTPRVSVRQIDVSEIWFFFIIVLRRTNVFTLINISSYFMSKTIQETILMYIFTKQIFRYSLKKFFGLTVTSIFGIIFAFPTYPSNIFTKGCSCDSGSLTWPNNPLLYHLTVHKVIMFFENTQLVRLKDNIIISHDFQREQVFIYVPPSHPFLRL